MSSPVPMPPNWAEYKTAEGRQYYHNLATGVTQWERPTAVHADLSGAEEADTSASSRATKGRKKGYASLRRDSLSSSESDEDPLALDAVALDFSDGALDGDMGKPTTLEVGEAREVGSYGNNKWFFNAIDISFAQSLFDVSTAAVGKRVVLSVAPIKPVTGDRGEPEFSVAPDIYGPFWIATTLILCLFAAANSAQFVLDRTAPTNVAFFGVAAAIVYGVVCFVPFVAFFLLHFGNARSVVGVAQLASLFGYSLAIWMPVSFLLIVPVEALKWVLCVCAMIIGLLFLAINMLREITNLPEVVRYPLIALLLVGHVSIMLVVKLYFFW